MAKANEAKKKNVAMCSQKEVTSSKSKVKSKPITVIMLESNSCATIPKDKKKLRAEKKLNFCLFSADDSVEIVRSKILSAFPEATDRTLVFLQATQTGDLFDPTAGSKEFCPDGKTVIDLAGAGSLYLTTHPIPKRCSDPVTVIVQPIKNQQPRLLVAPKTYQISKG